MRIKIPHLKKLISSSQNLLKFYIALLVICIPAEPLFSFSSRWILIILGVGVVICTQKKIFVTSYLKFQIFFILMLVVSLIYSPEGAGGINIIMTQFRAVLQSYLIVLLSIQLKETTENRISWILNSYVAGTIIIILYTLMIEYDNIFNSFGYWRMGKNVFENNGTFMLLSYSIIISLLWTLFCFAEDKNNKKIFFLLSVFFLMAAFVSGTKKTVFAAGVGIVLYVLLKYRKKCIKLIIGIISICVLVAVGYYFMMENEFIYTRIGYRIENYFLALRGLEVGTQSTTSRALMRTYGMSLFFANPIIGNGVSSFRWYFQEYAGKFLYSHCNYVELLCNHGLIGCSFYYFYYLWLTYKSFKVYFAKTIPIYLFMCVFLITLLVLDYGQVSYYRIHYMLIAQLAALALVNFEKYRFGINDTK